MITVGSSSAVDNDAAVITQVNPPWQIVSTRGPLWFEARIKFDTIADTKVRRLHRLVREDPPGLVLPITATAGTMADKISSASKSQETLVLPPARVAVSFAPRTRPMVKRFRATLPTSPA